RLARPSCSGAVPIRRLLLLVFCLLPIATAARAHPHIFIDARATIVFDDRGALAGIRHSWTFDEEFSVWSVQGLDTDGDGQISIAETQELADEHLRGLSEYAFYTYAGEGERDLDFATGSGATLTYENGR